MQAWIPPSRSLDLYLVAEMRWHDLPRSDFVIENRKSVKDFYCQESSDKNNNYKTLLLFTFCVLLFQDSKSLTVDQVDLDKER